MWFINGSVNHTVNINLLCQKSSSILYCQWLWESDFALKNAQASKRPEKSLSQFGLWVLHTFSTPRKPQPSLLTSLHLSEEMGLTILKKEIVKSEENSIFPNHPDYQASAFVATHFAFLLPRQITPALYPINPSLPNMIYSGPPSWITFCIWLLGPFSLIRTAPPPFQSWVFLPDLSHLPDLQMLECPEAWPAAASAIHFPSYWFACNPIALNNISVLSVLSEKY